MQPVVVNSLLRIQTERDLSGSGFELFDERHNLWVMELTASDSEALTTWCSRVERILESASTDLQRVSQNAKDYTLFIGVLGDHPSPVRIPRSLLSLSVTAGFEIELYLVSDEDPPWRAPWKFPQSSPIEILEQIVARPGMYWGNSDNHFHSFVAFHTGSYLAEHAITNASFQIIPCHFDHFVTEYFGHPFPYGGHGWMSLIEVKSSSPEDALQLLLKLRKLYESSRFPELDQ